MRREGKRERGQSGLVYLDRTLWKSLSAPEADEELQRAWLALQCSLIGDVYAGALVLGSETEGALKPAAVWPDEGAVPTELAEAAEMAIVERRGVVMRQPDDPTGPVAVAFPLQVEGVIQAVTAVALGPHSDADLQAALRRLQWGMAWIEAHLLRRRSAEQAGVVDRLTLVLDLVAEVVERESARGAATALATELATRLDAERASFGVVRGGRVRLTAVSHSSKFSGRMNLARALEAAMQEAVDQAAMVRSPEPKGLAPVVTRRHQALLASPDCTSDMVITAPVIDRGRVVGALTVELRDQAAADALTAEAVEAVAAVAGPVVVRARQEERWLVAKAWASLSSGLGAVFGPRRLGVKLGVGAVAAVIAFFALYATDYRVTADAEVEGALERVIAAPLDGYVVAESARPGDRVKAGDILARLDDRDLRIEMHAWLSRREQHRKERIAAIAAKDRAKTQIVQAQIDETEAQIEMLEAQLSRTSLVAPFDGVVLSGDLSQSLGVAVRKGDVIFRLAPLETYRVALQVDERDIMDIAAEQTGTLVLAALPEARLPVRVRKIMPVTRAEDGATTFRVEGVVEKGAQRLRPGMTGIAKIEAGERRLIWIWSRRFVHWLRVQWFRWAP